MSRTDVLTERAGRLRAAHHAGAPLVLPNAWDAANARAVVEAGFPVVATTSGGVAAALGFADHEQARRRRRCSPRSPGSPRRSACR